MDPILSTVPTQSTLIPRWIVIRAIFSADSMQGALTKSRRRAAPLSAQHSRCLNCDSRIDANSTSLFRFLLSIGKPSIPPANRLFAFSTQHLFSSRFSVQVPVPSSRKMAANSNGSGNVAVDLQKMIHEGKDHALPTSMFDLIPTVS